MLSSCLYLQTADRCLIAIYMSVIKAESHFLWNSKFIGWRVKSAMNKSTMHNHLFIAMEWSLGKLTRFHFYMWLSWLQLVGKIIHLKTKEKLIQQKKNIEVKHLDLRESKKIKFIKKSSLHKVKSVFGREILRIPTVTWINYICLLFYPLKQKFPLFLEV